MSQFELSDHESLFIAANAIGVGLVCLGEQCEIERANAIAWRQLDRAGASAHSLLLAAVPISGQTLGLSMELPESLDFRVLPLDISTALH